MADRKVGNFTMGGAFPEAKAGVTLRYCTEVTIDPAAAAMGFYAFSANSIYDPDITGVGHQPAGRDQWAAVYNNYIVTESRIRAWFNPRATTGRAIAVGIQLDDDGAFAGIETTRAMEQPNSVWTVTQEHALVTDMTFLEHKYVAPKESRSRDYGALLPSWGAAMGNNPIDPAGFILWVGEPAASMLDIGVVDVVVVIEYVCTFTEPVTIVQS